MLDRSRPGRTRFKLAFVLVCLGAIALIAAGCGGDDDDGDGDAAAGPTEDFTLTLPFQDSIVWNGYEIGKGPGGTFEEQCGLAPESVATEGNSFTIQQLISGKVDYAISGAAEVFIANARGNEVLGVANIYDDVFTVAATDESGTESIEDLEGQALGVTDLGGGEIPLVNAVLNDAGLEPDQDVELKVVGPGGAAAFKALESGEVAAFAGAINDLVPLESEGLRFNTILPDEFLGLPSDLLVVRPEALEDEELRDQLQCFMKAWYTATIFGEENPDEGLARICEEVPEDCQDMEFARGFYDATIEIAIDEARRGGCHDYEALTVSRDAVAAVDAPNAADVDPEEAFPSDFCEETVPSEEDVEAFAERAAGGTE
jgi:NitT/TauT family transport system substrate-binding protein